MSGDHTMQLPRVENKVNWTTVIAALTAAFTVVVSISGWVYSQGQFRAQFSAMEQSINVDRTRSETRIENVERLVSGMENLAYRVTLVEQANINITSTLAELTRTLSEQGADIRVVREILTRIDNTRADHGE